jgi:propionate CoA-transferase
MVFGGSFTAGGLQVAVENGELRIVAEGRHSKFVESLAQISFSSKNAREGGQTVLYVTERAVFSLSSDGLTLIEIAPGIDLQKDVLDRIPFEIDVSPDLKTMPAEVFSDRSLGLQARLESEPLPMHPKVKALLNH